MNNRINKLTGVCVHEGMMCLESMFRRTGWGNFHES